MSIKHLTLAEITEIHQILIEEFEGEGGIRDIGALEAAIIRPQLGYYETLLEQAAALMEGLILTYPFLDGNKRTAFFAADIFLRLNGQEISCENKDAYMSLLKQDIRLDQLLSWLKEHTQSVKK
jgi:death-on-curing protein